MCRSGITAPIQAGGVKQDNLGLGAEVHGQVNEGDDAFEQYRYASKQALGIEAQQVDVR